MTRMIYENIPVLLETNGDCSTITLNFDNEDIELVAKLRASLKSQGFRILRKHVNDNQLRLFSPTAPLLDEEIE